MKWNKLEYFYLCLSILILVLTGLFYQTTSAKNKNVQTTTTRASSSSSSNQTNPEKIKDLTERLDEIAKNPTKDTVATIKKEIQALGNGTDKKKLLESLADVEKDLATIISIEANLGLAQTTGEEAYLQTAQNGINSLKAEVKKAELQEKLNEIVAALASQNTASDNTETEDEIESFSEEATVSESYQETYTPSYQESSNYTTYSEEQADVTTVQETVVTPTTPTEETSISPSVELDVSTESGETSDMSSDF